MTARPKVCIISHLVIQQTAQELFTPVVTSADLIYNFSCLFSLACSFSLATPGNFKHSMSDSDVEQTGSSTCMYTPSEIERLGRERPDAFKTIWVELGFCFSLLGSMFIAEYFASGFNILLPPVTHELGMPKNVATWPASVFALVTGAFLLPFGRLADMYGGYIVFNAGLVWLLLWSIIAGFSQNYIMLIVCRGLQGLGSAAFMPSGIMLLGSLVSYNSLGELFERC